jgi:hypothetical protein
MRFWDNFLFRCANARFATATAPKEAVSLALGLADAVFYGPAAIILD